MSKVVFAVLFCGLTTFAAAQKLKDVLQKHRDTYNEQFWSQVQTLSARGQIAQAKETFSFQLLAKRKRRLKILNADRRWVRSTDGTAFWKLESATGDILDLSPEEKTMLQLVWSFGTQLDKLEKPELNGVLPIDEKDCYWISGKWDRYDADYYIERETGRLVKINLSYLDKGKVRYISKKVLQHRVFQGLLINAVIEIKTSGKTWEMSFEEFLVGDAIKDRVFEKPE